MNRLKDHTWGKRHDFLSKNHPGNLHENKRHSVTFFSSVYITNKRDPVLQSLVKIHSPAHSSHISSVNQPLYSLDLKVEGLSKKPTFFVNADKNFALSLATHRQIVSCDVQVFLMNFVSKEVQKPEVYVFAFSTFSCPTNELQSSHFNIYNLTFWMERVRYASKRRSHDFRLTSVAQKHLCLSP